MDENEYIRDMLYIPQGLTLKPEIFEGYGKSELMKSAAVTLVAGLITVIIYLINRSVTFSVVFMLVSVASSIMAFSRDKSNISMVDQIGFMIRFHKSQKSYSYRYMDEWLY